MKKQQKQGSYRVLRQLRQALATAIDAGDEAGIARLVAQYPEDTQLGGEDCYLLGRVAERMKETERAEVLYRQALAAQDIPAWCRGAAASSMAALLVRTARGDEAGPYYEQSLAAKDNASGWLEEYSNVLFFSHDQAGGKDALAAAKRYGDHLADVKPYTHVPRRRHEKIRIGYVSADLHRHIVAFFAYALLRAYDHGAFEVYCYLNGEEDEVSETFRGWVDGWRNVRGRSYAEIAAQIHDDEIDILFDLGGHTANNLLPVFAYRPAPIQMTGIGYFDTTGLPQMDYFLADRTTLPEGEAAPFTEQIVRMERSHLCYMWHGEPSELQPLPAGQNGFVTFGSLNDFRKVNDDVLRVWAKVLAAVPGSRLLLKAGIFDDAYGTRLALAKMERAGIDVSRVMTEGRTDDYLRTYERIDIALDTFPYPGGGTTCDALYMGVPVVTLTGGSHHERFGESLLKNAGHSELCAATPEAYVAIAKGLAEDLPRLRHLHQTLRRELRQSPVTDMAGYMVELEHHYQRMFWAWLSRGKSEAQKKKAVEKTERELLKAYEAQDYARVIVLGSRLLWRPEYVKRDAGAVGRAYLNLPLSDWVRTAWCFSHADLTAPIRQIEYNWLAAMAENRLRHHIPAQALYEASIAACKRYAAAKDESSKSYWDNPPFQAEIYTEVALNELVLGQVAEAAEHYRMASERSGSLHGRCGVYGSYLMALHHMDIPPEEMLAAHKGFAAFLEKVPRYEHRHHAHHDRIRVGYLSGDFRHHVMFYFYYQLLAGHDAQRFELYAYSLGKTHDGFTKLVRKAVDVFRDMEGEEPDRIAAQVYEDEIDILVDLGGHTSSSGLDALGWRPAPVQVSGLGYMDTTGLPDVDYLITDRACDPEDGPCYLTEQPLYQTSMFCYTGRSDVPACQGAPCRTRGFVMFGVFNRYQKITDEMLALWQRILAAVPGSRLLCKAEGYHDDALTDRAYARFAAAGLDMERVIFEPSSDDYMERYLSVDIALDTYPYVGGGTTCDALYMGVPVVTRYGAGHGSRFGLSVLTAAGLGELAVPDGASYVARAVSLAEDTELLDALHKNLRTMLFASPLMDTQRYVREMEENYTAIWKRYKETQQEVSS